MARGQDIFTLVGKRMTARAHAVRSDYEQPPVAELIARIDRALTARRAA